MADGADAPPPAVKATPQTRILQAVATLLIGAAGGYLASLIGVPLPWMIGAMLANTIVAIADVRIAGHGVMLPLTVRTVMVPVIGVMLGSGFTPEVARQMIAWWPSVVGLFLFVGLSVITVYTLYRRLFDLDRPTAYFAAIPGGVIESAILGEMAGGDQRTISLIHFCRILIAVLTIPLAFRLIFGPVGSAAVGADAFKTAISLSDAVLLIGAGVLGFYLGRLTKLPGAAISGPMILSALVHGLGFTEAHPPTLLVIAAQIVLGSALGARFSGFPVSRVFVGLKAAALGVAAMMTIGIAIGLVVWPFVPETMAGIILAYAPGGLAEMSLIALSLQMSVPFVAAHHIARIIIAVTLPPLIYKWRIDPTAEFHR